MTIPCRSSSRTIASGVPTACPGKAQTGTCRARPAVVRGEMRIAAVRVILVPARGACGLVVGARGTEAPRRDPARAARPRRGAAAHPNAVYCPDAPPLDVYCPFFLV